MDDKWFKSRQKIAGVTAEDIAREMGRDRSVVSHIYNGRQRMSLDWARAFAKVLDVPIEEVLRRAGVTSAETAQRIAPGFAEADAAPFVGSGGEGADTTERARVFGGNRPGVDVWQVKSRALELAGYLPGDFLLVDSHQGERSGAGDIVIAQRYDMHSATARTVLRRYEPPVLVADTANPEDKRVFVVDGSNVVIRGRVVASWRCKD